MVNWNNILNVVEMRVIDEHRCKEKLYDNNAILKCKSEFNQAIKWVLVDVWIAGKEEVADGEADEIGEVKKLTTIFISYCPFCGEYLKPR